MKASISLSTCISFLYQIKRTKEQNIISTVTASRSRTTDCIPRTSNCYEVNEAGGAGCDEPICENSVCECDPYCCDIQWDLSCSGYPDNYFSPGCSARVLCCQQPIEPYTPTCQTIIPSTSSCLVPHAPGGGCDDDICEALVCDCDPYCCQGGGWDISCVGYPDNYFNIGCSAQALCCTESDIDIPEIGGTSVPAASGPRPTPTPTFASSPTLPPMSIAPPIKISITATVPSNEYCDCYRERIPIVTSR